MKKNREFKENPKKKKTRKESREEKEKSKKEIKIINEIPLEKRIESTERGISENEFGEFFEQPELPKVSPSLTKINAPQRIPTSLEGNLGGFSISDSKDDKEENNSFKYNIGNPEDKDETKYFSYGNKPFSSIMQVSEMQKFDKKNPWEKSEIEFQNPSWEKERDKNNFEKYNQVKMSTPDELKKESLFEKKEIKYTPGKY